MKFYDLNSKITFGKFKGKTLREILDIQPSYLEWCLNHIDYFFIPEIVVTEIRDILPDFIFSEKVKQKIFDKYSHWENEQLKNEKENDAEGNNLQDQGYEEEQGEYDNYEYHEEKTHENYNGSWAQDEEGYSDQDIRDVFDGDPLAYWNID